MKTKYIILISIIFCISCAYSVGKRFDVRFAKPLKVEKAEPSEITGIFKIIFYGARYSDDVETVSIFDCGDDQYDIEPFAPDFDFRIEKEIPDKEALAKALDFISFHHSFHKYSLKKIINEKGKIIGFELRPLYYPFVYGTSDVMDINYWLEKNGKVRVTIKLLPSVERLQLQRGSDEAGDGGN